MAVEEHPIGLLTEKHHAIAERVASYVAIIINTVLVPGKSPTGQNVQEESVGVGSACLWRGKKLILTAKHVLEGANPEDLRFFFRQGGKIDWAVKPDLASIGSRVSLDVRDIVRSRTEDLASIVLSDSPEHVIDFIPLPKAFGKVPPAGGGTLLYGCPFDQRVPMNALRRGSELRVGFTMRPRGCWAVVKGEVPELFPSWFDTAQHFLLHYDPKDEGAMPHGFSGAGVWYRRSARGALWSADPVLAGIQSSWHKSSNTMIVIRSKVVRRFLESSIY